MLTEFTTFELSTLKEAIQFMIDEHERYIGAVAHNERLSSLLDDKIALRKRKLEALYTQRVQVLDAFQQVKRRELFLQN